MRRFQLIVLIISMMKYILIAVGEELGVDHKIVIYLVMVSILIVIYPVMVSILLVIYLVMVSILTVIYLVMAELKLVIYDLTTVSSLLTFW